MLFFQQFKLKFETIVQHFNLEDNHCFPITHFKKVYFFRQIFLLKKTLALIRNILKFADQKESKKNLEKNINKMVNNFDHFYHHS